MSRFHRLLAAFMVLSALLAFGPPGLEAQSSSETRARAAADAAIAQLRSPYCPGRMLENCTSSAAGALRDSIHALADQGASTEELVEWMLARHGEEYRGVPQGRGAGLFAWIMPPLALLVAMGALLLWFRSSRKATGTAPPSPESAISEADRHELAQALKDWETTGDSGR